MNEYNPADQQAGIAYAERVASKRFASTGEQVSQTTRMLMGCAFEAGAAHGRGQVPAGWKLVPVEPTREMLVATNWANDPAAGYRAMLVAAPAPPAAEQPDAVKVPRKVLENWLDSADERERPRFVHALRALLRGGEA